MPQKLGTHFGKVKWNTECNRTAIVVEATDLGKRRGDRRE